MSFAFLNYDLPGYSYRAWIIGISISHYGLCNASPYINIVLFFVELDLIND